MFDTSERIPVLRLSERLRRARKTHTCSACGGTISPGQRYWSSFFLVDGDPYTEKLCGCSPSGY